MDTKKIGTFISFNRKLKGLTQEQLGERLGVSNKTVSRWENGNYMPDLSLLEPLSNELGITLNELLAGEKSEADNMCETAEKNLISTMNYASKKVKNEQRKSSFIVIGMGLLTVLCSFVLCDSESRWTAVYSMLGIVLLIAGMMRELKCKSLMKKMLLYIFLFIFIFTGLYIVDYIGINLHKRAPIYRYAAESVKKDTEITVYRSWLYNVYQINAGTPNEYYVVDNKKEYTLNTVPVSPFNRELSGIDNLEKYKNEYIGNNSNTGMLIDNLPLSECGYVFEIDDENAGLIIDYYSTDWYANQNLYIEKSLIYNSVSIFILIDNVNYIQYNFSGNSYKIMRNDLIKNYPDYDKLLTGDRINKGNFNLYVERKMNDTAFIKSMFRIYSE